MKTRTGAGALAAILLAGVGSVAMAASIPSPSEFLGFEVGADKKLADYRQIAKYFQALKAASPRVDIEVLGKTTLGEDMFMAVISSEQNIQNVKRIREIARRLADPRGLSDEEARQLEKEGKLVLLVTCNIHSTEIGASQMAMEWAHALATATERVQLGALVTGNTYRNPTLLAKAITTLDVISAGRAILSAGTGWFELEHRQLGFE